MNRGVTDGAEQEDLEHVKQQAHPAASAGEDPADAREGIEGRKIGREPLGAENKADLSDVGGDRGEGDAPRNGSQRRADGQESAEPPRWSRRRW